MKSVTEEMNVSGENPDTLKINLLINFFPNTHYTVQFFYLFMYLAFVKIKQNKTPFSIAASTDM